MKNKFHLHGENQGGPKEMMRAWVLHNIGDIRMEDTEMEDLRPGEVRIRIKAAGVCGSDIPRIYATGAHRMPLIPGHELAGVVEGIGRDVNPGWLGRRVGVYPLIPCGKCAPCKSGHPETCRDYDYIGSRRDGAFAEYVSAPVSNLIELPENVSFEEGAMLEPMAVAVHAMRTGVGKSGAAVTPDADVVVCGLGAIGLLLVMFLKERRFGNVHVIGNKDGQRKRAAALGVPEKSFCDSRTENAAQWIRDNAKSPAVFFECTGKNECLSYGIESAAAGARIVLVGNPRSDMSLPRDTYWKLLRSQLAVFGSWNSTFLPDGPVSCAGTDDWHYVLDRLTEHRVNPASLITHRYPLEELETGLRMMADKTEDYCKVMMCGEGLRQAFNFG